MMKPYILMLSIAAILGSCSQKKSNIKIEPINALNINAITHLSESDSAKTLYYKVYNYGFSDNDLDVIKTYVQKHLDPDLAKYQDYQIIFYTAVDDTDLVGLRDHPDRYYNLENMIYKVWWSKGKLVSESAFKDGQSLDPEVKITITPIPLNDTVKK